jgi:DnaK suppressor protein
LITVGRTEELDAMLTRFEEQYEAHTERLARLMARQRHRRTAIYEFAEISNCRKALAETARTLQRMAERDYGRCGHCSADIPIERLVVRPDSRYCPRCEEAVPA